MQVDVAYRVVVAAARASLILLVGCGSPSAVSEKSAVVDFGSSESEKPTVVSGRSAAKPQPAGDATPSTHHSLGEKLGEFSAAAKGKIPAVVLQTFAEGIEQVRSTGIVEAAFQAGDSAVDAELPSAQGNRVKLSDLWEQGPIVLMWYRGGWCPYCNLQLEAMQEALPAIRAAGGTLVAISPETPDNARSTRDTKQLEFVVLSDVGNQVARQYGLVFKLPPKVSSLYKQMIDLVQYNGDESDELPLAATYVIDSSGVIRYAFLDADYAKRAEPAEIVAALQAL